MKILLSCPYDWNAPGGVQVHIDGLARSLQARGHDVRVLAPGKGRARQTYVRFVALPYRFSYSGTVSPLGVGPYSMRAIGRQLDSFAPDIVHVHEPFTPSTSMYTAISAGKRHLPVVATFHAYLEASRLLTTAAPALRRVMRPIGPAIAVSEAAATFAERPLGRRPEVIPNGVDVALFENAAADGAKPGNLPAGRILLWVNRLDPQKGFGVALEAFRALCDTTDDLSFVVVGDGSDRDLADPLPSVVRERVHMLGAVKHADLPACFAAADVFISPATGQESFGIVLVEAMASGVPVVAGDIPGYREVIHDGSNGRLVPPGDAKALASAVSALLADPAAAEALVTAGHAAAAEYSWEQITARIEAVYGRALKQGAAAR